MEIETLQKQYQEAVAIKEMLNTEGWKVLNRELDIIYATNVNRLIEKEDQEARIKIKSVVELRRQIEYIIAHGKKANEQLSKGG